MRDAGGLTATGTITIDVLDSLATTYKLTLRGNGPSAGFNGDLNATLTGTTASGESVNREVSLRDADGVLEFAGIAAGDYQIEIPAVPFLVGME